MTTVPNARPDHTFSYQKGPIEVTVPWYRPNPQLFEQWWHTVEPLFQPLEYYVWVCGGFMENKPDTWDIDIILTSDKPLDHFDSDELSTLMIQCTDVALNQFNILVDVVFFTNFDGLSLSKDGVDSFWYSTENYKKEGCRQAKQLVFYTHIIKNGKILTDYRNHKQSQLKQLGNQLWSIEYKAPSDKHIWRIEHQNYCYAAPQLIFTPDPSMTTHSNIRYYSFR